MLLPLTPEAITADWLTEALQERHPGVRVTNLQTVEIIPGTSTIDGVGRNFFCGTT